MIWQQVKNPTPINKLQPTVPLKLASVVHKMLRKKPDERYATPLEVFDALTPFIADEVPPPPDPSWIPERLGRIAVGRAAIPNPLSAAVVTRPTAPPPPNAGGGNAGGPASHVFAPTFPPKTNPPAPPAKKKAGASSNARVTPVAAASPSKSSTETGRVSNSPTDRKRDKSNIDESGIDTTPEANSDETPPRKNKRRKPRPTDDDYDDSEPAPRSNSVLIIGILVVALLLALGGIAYLLLK
jgi:hypothetical protein